jgi:hypothetical protein
MFRSLFDHRDGICIFMFSLHCVLSTFLLINLLMFFTGGLFCTLHLYTYLSVETVCVKLFLCCTIGDFVVVS